jgi:hypothetical protein
MQHTLLQHPINLLRRCRRIPQTGLRHCDVRMHLSETAEVAIIEGVMDSLSSVLDLAFWGSYDVDDRGPLSIRSRDRVDGREFSDSKSGDKSAESFDARIAVSGVAGIQFVGVADPE